jgi:hypothetical protein
MIAALVGFGVAVDLAVVGVLTYRAIAFWLPTIPGAIAYVQLVRQVHALRGPGATIRGTPRTISARSADAHDRPA